MVLDRIEILPGLVFGFVRLEDCLGLFSPLPCFPLILFHLFYYLSIYFFLVFLFIYLFIYFFCFLGKMRLGKGKEKQREKADD